MRLFPDVQVPFDDLFNTLTPLGSLSFKRWRDRVNLAYKPAPEPDDPETYEMIRAAGFGNAKYRNLSMGIAALHSGWKI